MYKLIYLQDAIDALVKRTCLPWELLKIIHPMLCVLETLPSAEPEIIRCKDCKYYQQDHLFKVGFCDGRKRNNDDFCSRAERRTDETD